MRQSERERIELQADEPLKLEKNDEKALWISGMLMIGLPCLMLILLITGVTMLLFGL